MLNGEQKLSKNTATFLVVGDRHLSAEKMVRTLGNVSNLYALIARNLVVT